jgi:hypothetical protein
MVGDSLMDDPTSIGNFMDWALGMVVDDKVSLSFFSIDDERYSGSTPVLQYPHLVPSLLAFFKNAFFLT